MLFLAELQAVTLNEYMSYSVKLRLLTVIIVEEVLNSVMALVIVLVTRTAV